MTIFKRLSELEKISSFCTRVDTPNIVLVVSMLLDHEDHKAHLGEGIPSSEITLNPSPRIITIVSFQEWFALLEKRSSSWGEANQVNITSRFWQMIVGSITPMVGCRLQLALKLQDFFEGMAEADAAVSSGPNLERSGEAGGARLFALALQHRQRPPVQHDMDHNFCQNHAGR